MSNISNLFFYSGVITLGGQLASRFNGFIDAGDGADYVNLIELLKSETEREYRSNNGADLNPVAVVLTFNKVS